MSTLVDWNGNKSRYLHVECINGGLHPLDTVSHTTPLSQAQADEISMIRAPPEAVDPVLPYARCPRTVREAAAVQGPEWWTRLAWDDMRKLHGLTLVDVPRACRAKYADLVVAAIADVEAAAPAMLAGDSRAREQAWMKLCLVDVMVLNSTRSPGESQTMAVNRRIRNFQGGAVGGPLAGGYASAGQAAGGGPADGGEGAQGRGQGGGARAGWTGEAGSEGCDGQVAAGDRPGEGTGP